MGSIKHGQPHGHPERMNPHKVRGKVNPKTAASTLKRASKLRPKLAIILGSGFNTLANKVKLDREIPYQKLAGFFKPSVAGHTGTAVIGRLSGIDILILNGRTHYYEGRPLSQITHPIRVIAEYGIKDLIITNAAGGINQKFKVGDFMLFKDHLNFMGENPLKGPAISRRERFIDLSQVYDPILSKQLRAAARKTNTRLHSGTYCAVSGPSYETPAEINAFGRLGADAIGMSTVPESIVAHQCGIRVAAISCITNEAAGANNEPLSHKDVLETGLLAAKTGSRLLREFAHNYV